MSDYKGPVRKIDGGNGTMQVIGDDVLIDHLFAGVTIVLSAKDLEKITEDKWERDAWARAARVSASMYP